MAGCRVNHAQAATTPELFESLAASDILRSLIIPSLVAGLRIGG